MSSKTFPSLEFERSQFAGRARYLIGIDEVGRGAIAGPVAVGAAIIDLQSELPWPAGLADSKLLSERQRENLFEPVSNWSVAWGVGQVSAQEIDERGIVWALAKSAERALDQVLANPEFRSQLVSDGAAVLLDGIHNWLGESAMGLPVTVRPKADRDCVSVAAASVLAKVTRDRLMIDLAKLHPAYGFEGHKGYAAAKHIDAIQTYGPSEVHRISWLSKILAGPNLSPNE